MVSTPRVPARKLIACEVYCFRLNFNTSKLVYWNLRELRETYNGDLIVFSRLYVRVLQWKIPLIAKSEKMPFKQARMDEEAFS